MSSQYSNDEAITMIVTLLASDDTGDVAGVLEDLYYYPIPDARLLLPLEHLLTDKRLARLIAPPYFFFGEIAWWAGRALAAEWAALGIEGLVSVPATFKALSGSELGKLKMEAKITENKFGVNALQILIEQGYITLQDWKFNPQWEGRHYFRRKAKVDSDDSKSSPP